MTTAAPHTTEAHHPPSPGTGIHRFLRPGWLRVLWTTPLFFGIGLALVTGFRWLFGWDPIWDGVPIVTVELVTTPLGFLVGLGGFDYWALLRERPPDRGRRPLQPRSEELARLLPDQHRPQGDRDPVRRHDDLLLLLRRPARDALPRGARASGRPVLQPADVQRPGLRPRGADDLPVHHPGVRRSRELRDPADARGRRHGVPAAERAVVLAAADRRDHADRRHGRARRRPVGRLDVLRAALLAPAGRAGVLQHGACSGRARARS